MKPEGVTVCTSQLACINPPKGQRPLGGMGQLWGTHCNTLWLRGTTNIIRFADNSVSFLPIADFYTTGGCCEGNWNIHGGLQYFSSAERQMILIRREGCELTAEPHSTSSLDGATSDRLHSRAWNTKTPVWFLVGQSVSSHLQTSVRCPSVKAAHPSQHMISSCPCLPQTTMTNIRAQIHWADLQLAELSHFKLHTACTSCSVFFAHIPHTAFSLVLSSTQDDHSTKLNPGPFLVFKTAAFVLDVKVKSSFRVMYWQTWVEWRTDPRLSSACGTAALPRYRSLRIARAHVCDQAARSPGLCTTPRPPSTAPCRSDLQGERSIILCFFEENITVRDNTGWWPSRQSRLSASGTRFTPRQDEETWSTGIRIHDWQKVKTSTLRQRKGRAPLAVT